MRTLFWKSSQTKKKTLQQYSVYRGEKVEAATGINTSNILLLEIQTLDVVRIQALTDSQSFETAGQTKQVREFRRRTPSARQGFGIVRCSYMFLYVLIACVSILIQVIMIINMIYDSFSYAFYDVLCVSIRSRMFSRSVFCFFCNRKIFIARPGRPGPWRGQRPTCKAQRSPS